MSRARRVLEATLLTALLGAAPLFASGCSDEATGLLNDGGSSGFDGGFLYVDGAFVDPDGNIVELDGSVPIPDGAVVPGDDGSTSSNGDGSTTLLDGAIVPSDDGGNPLEEPLSAFCRGEGSVVIVGAADECAGQIAQDTFQFGLCACNTIEVMSTLSIDAFDSTRGAYGQSLPDGGTNVLDDGHLGLNGALDMSGKLTVHGGAFIGGGGLAVGSQSLITSTVYANGDAVQNMSSTTLGRNAFFNGNVVGRFDIAGDLHVPQGASVAAGTTIQGRTVRGAIPPVRPCPCDADETLDVAALTAYGRTHNDNAVRHVVTSTAWESGNGPSMIMLPCGRYYITRIQTGSGLTIRAEGRTVLFVDGDMNIGGSFSLELAPGAEVDLFIAGSLSVGASARFGDPSAPSKVRTYVGGTGTINLSASAVFGGNLYAPHADVVFNASADLYGALFSKSATFSGSANVHFDSAVRTAGRSCETPDGGVTDGGPAPTDASVPTDGSVRTDGSVPTDASVTPDGGTPPADAGPRDAGSTPADAGTRDAGSTTPDAGPAGCTGCGQCGDLACFIDPGQTSGTCGACTSDLDCCAPNVCIAGSCRINL